MDPLNHLLAWKMMKKTYLAHFLLTGVCLPFIGAYCVGVVGYSLAEESLSTIFGASMLVANFGVIYFFPLSLIASLVSGFAMALLKHHHVSYRCITYLPTLILCMTYASIIRSIGSEIGVPYVGLIIISILVALLFSEPLHRVWFRRVGINKASKRTASARSA